MDSDRIWFRIRYGKNEAWESSIFTWMNGTGVLRLYCGLSLSLSLSERLVG